MISMFSFMTPVNSSFANSIPSPFQLNSIPIDRKTLVNLGLIQSLSGK